MRLQELLQTAGLGEWPDGEAFVKELTQQTIPDVETLILFEPDELDEKPVPPVEVKPLKRKPVKNFRDKNTKLNARRALPKKKIAVPLKSKPKSKLVGTGRLYLRTTEAWATVLLNGTKMGITPLANVEVPAGTHELLLINSEAGYQRRIEIVVKNGEVIKKTIRFP